jgi:hypothetical protein
MNMLPRTGLRMYFTVETREGWPLLTVETETNGDLQSTNEGVLPWLVR